MKKLLSMLAFAACLGTLTSCLKDGDNLEDEYYYNNYFTITGSVNSGYTCYSDAGDIIIPNMSSVTSYCGSTGFGSIKRAHLIFSLNRQNVTYDENNLATITKADLESAQGFPCIDPISRTMADSLKVTSADSTWNFTLKQSWTANGFLNVYWLGYYSLDNSGAAIRPTLNLVYDEEKIAQDSIRFFVYYNRHDTMPSVNYYSGESVNSFDIADLMATVPGKDTVNVLIQTQMGDSIWGRVSRNKFKHPY